MRVYHKLDGDYQSFQSLIISSDMTGKDVVQMAVTRLSLMESPEAFKLVQKTNKGGQYQLVHACMEYALSVIYHAHNIILMKCN